MVGINELAKDYTATKARDDYIFFLADLSIEGDTKPGLVRVNKQTGQPTAEIVLGTKNPTYTVDPSGRLFFKSDSKTISCYRF